MSSDYPTNYYAFRRVLHQQIREKVRTLDERVREGDLTDKEELILELKIFARELSKNSGVPLKGILKLFYDLDIQLDVKEPPKGEA